MRPLLSSFLLGLAVACLPPGPKADLVLRGGKILPLPPERPVAEALAATGQRITGVGTTAEISEFVGPETRVIDLEGALTIPGFIDSHAHLMSLGFSQMRLNLTGTRSSSEIARMVRLEAERSAEADERGWGLGGGWDQNDWGKKEFPTAAMLDHVVSDRAGFLTRVAGHAGRAHSEAMAEA